MVEIVLAEVILRQVCDVGELDVWDVARAKEADIHLLKRFPLLALSCLTVGIAPIVMIEPLVVTEDVSRVSC
jgi:hypothetical protein